MNITVAGQTDKPAAALGFHAGLKQVRIGEYSKVCRLLMAALGIANRTSFGLYASGRREMKVSQAEAVETIFREHGITENIWGR